MAFRLALYNEIKRETRVGEGLPKPIQGLLVEIEKASTNDSDQSFDQYPRDEEVGEHDPHRRAAYEVLDREASNNSFSRYISEISCLL